MLHSMTAFSRLVSQLPGGQGVWELRSVNHRYLDAHFRLPEAVRQHEPILRAALQEQLQRGRIEVSLKLIDETAVTDELNTVVLESLRTLSAQLGKVFPDAQGLSQADILAFPGVLTAPQSDQQQFSAALLSGFSEAVEQLSQHRAEEGARICQMLAERVAAIRERVSTLLVEKSEWEAELTARWQQKLADLVMAFDGRELDSQRLHQEVAILLTKADVAEELDRLLAHCDEVEAILNEAAKAACGRRLDFMIQELNREANTLGSKSTNQTLTQAAVELKVWIDQMREQIQNVE